jgi:hypothetical protein
VDDREEFPIQLEDDACTHAAHLGQVATFQLRDLRIECFEQRRCTNAHGLEHLPENTWLERTNVRGDLR